MEKKRNFFIFVENKKWGRFFVSEKLIWGFWFDYCLYKGVERWKLLYGMLDIKFKLGVFVWWDFRMLNIDGG